MLIHILAALGPLKLVVAGLLFLNLAWPAVRKWMVAGVVGLSAAEILLPQLWQQLGQLISTLTQSGPALQAAPTAAALAQSSVAIIITNALLATLVWFAVRGLQIWARSTVSRHERRFRTMIARDLRHHRHAHHA